MLLLYSVMPASSAEGLGNISAVLENTFKQQLIRQRSNTSANAPPNEEEENSAALSLVDQVLSNESEVGEKDNTAAATDLFLYIFIAFLKSGLF